MPRAGVEEGQRHIEAVGGGAADAEEAALIVIVEEGNQPHLRGGVVVGGDGVVAVFNLLGVAAGGGEHAADLEIERVIHHRIELESAAALGAGIDAAFGIRAVIDLAEHEEVRLADTGRVGVNRRAPVLPEPHLDVLDRVHAEAVEPRLADPILVNLHHVRAHVGRLGAEIIQPGQLAQFHMLRGIVIGDAAVVVEEVGERIVGRGVSGVVDVEGRRVCQ